VGDTVTENRTSKLPQSLGFREGTSSVHTSRTMMLVELSLVLEQVRSKAMADEYLAAIVELNILGKPRAHLADFTQPYEPRKSNLRIVAGQSALSHNAPLLIVSVSVDRLAGE
jgi:hypothetical protein